MSGFVLSISLLHFLIFLDRLETFNILSVGVVLCDFLVKF